MPQSIHQDLIAKGTVTYGQSHSAARAGDPVAVWGLNLGAFTRPNPSPWYQVAADGGNSRGFYQLHAAAAPLVSIAGPRTVVEGQSFTGDTYLAGSTEYRDCVFDRATVYASQVSDVAIVGGELRDSEVRTWKSDNVTVRDSRLLRSGIRVGRQCSHVAVWGNHFLRAGPMPALRFLAGTGHSAISNVFDGVDRGVVCQTSAGDVVDGLLCLGNVYRAIACQPGGDEHILIEGDGEVRRCLWLAERMYNCDRPALVVWGTTVKDCVWYDLQATGASRLWLSDQQKGTQESNYFLRCAFRGGGFFQLDPSTSGNVISECHWSGGGTYMTGSNQGDPAQVWTPSALVLDDGTGNEVQAPQTTGVTLPVHSNSQGQSL